MKIRIRKSIPFLVLGNNGYGRSGVWITVSSIFLSGGVVVVVVVVVVPGTLLDIFTLLLLFIGWQGCISFEYSCVCLFPSFSTKFLVYFLIYLLNHQQHDPKRFVFVVVVQMIHYCYYYFGVL